MKTAKRRIKNIPFDYVHIFGEAIIEAACAASTAVSKIAQNEYEKVKFIF